MSARVEVIARDAGPGDHRLCRAERLHDHIVMGTGDKRGLKRLVLGSVAAEVAGHARIAR